MKEDNHKKLVKFVFWAMIVIFILGMAVFPYLN